MNLIAWLTAGRLRFIVPTCTILLYAFAPSTMRAAFPHRVGRRLLDVHVLAGLHRPDGGERVPVIGDRDDDRVDVLVVERAAEVLDESGLERRDLREHLLVVDARFGEVRVDVAQRLDLDVLQLREASLERIALSANADAGRDDAIVRSENAVADARRRGKRRPEEFAAHRQSRCRRAEPRREVATRNAVFAVVSVAGHADLLLDPRPSGHAPTPYPSTRARRSGPGVRPQFDRRSEWLGSDPNCAGGRATWGQTPIGQVLG